MRKHYTRIHRKLLARRGLVSIFDYTPQYSHDGNTWHDYAEGTKHTKDAAFNVILSHSYRSQSGVNQNWKYSGLAGD